MAVNSKMMAERFIWIFAILGLLVFHFQNIRALKARTEKAEQMAQYTFYAQQQMQTEASSLRGLIDHQRKQIEDLQDPTGKRHSLDSERTARRTPNIAPTQMFIPK